MRSAGVVSLSLFAGALVVGSALAPRSAAAADAPPDFNFFKQRIEPVLQSVCAQCHAGKGQGTFALIVHAPGVPFPDAEHRKNYDCKDHDEATSRKKRKFRIDR